MTIYVSFTADPSTHTDLREALKSDFVFRFDVDNITLEWTTESFETYLLERRYQALSHYLSLFELPHPRLPQKNPASELQQETHHHAA